MTRQQIADAAGSLVAALIDAAGATGPDADARQEFALQAVTLGLQALRFAAEVAAEGSDPDPCDDDTRIDGIGLALSELKETLSDIKQGENVMGQKIKAQLDSILDKLTAQSDVIKGLESFLGTITENLMDARDMEEVRQIAHTIEDNTGRITGAVVANTPAGPETPAPETPAEPLPVEPPPFNPNVPEDPPAAPRSRPPA